MGFRATYQQDGGQFVLTLEDVVDIMLADGSSQRAYLVVQENPDGSRGLHYLDGGFRLLRFDSPCAEVVAGQCARHRIWWDVAGFPPRFGVGMPLYYKAGGFEAWQVDRQTSLTIQKSGDTYVLSELDPAFISAGTLLPGRYDFSPGRLAPDFMATERDGAPIPPATLIEYQTLAPLPVIPQLDRPTSVSHGHRVGDIGPTTEPWLDSRHSWSEVIQAARATSPEFAATLANGCIQRMEDHRVRHTSQPLLPMGKAVLAWYEVRTLQSAQHASWQIQLQQDRLTNETNWTVQETSAADARVTCDQLGEQAGPCVTAQQVFRAWQEIQLRHAGARESVVQYEPTLPPARAYMGDGSNGTLLYRMFMIPEWIDISATTISFQPHYIDLTANRGWLAYADLHADDAPTWRHDLACTR